MAISKIDIEKQRQLVIGAINPGGWEKAVGVALKAQELVLEGGLSHNNEAETRLALNSWLGMDFFTIPNPATIGSRSVVKVTCSGVDIDG